MQLLCCIMRPVHKQLIHKGASMPLCGEDVHTARATSCFLNKSTKGTHPMEGVHHFLELAFLGRLRQPAHVT